jgi:glycosyltransferase involved in cell wall biosynthesis
MRIGLVVPGFSSEATDWCIPALRHLVDKLAETDDVRVFAVRYPYRVDRYRIGRAEVTAVGGGQRRGAATAQVWRDTLAAVVAEHRRRSFDVLHAFWATESGLLAALGGRALRRPTVVSLAGGELVGLADIAYGDQLSRAQRLKVRMSLWLANLVTAGSNSLVELARRHAPRARIVKAPLGVDTRLFEAAHDWPEPPRVVHVGALTPIKDQATLLCAFAVLCERVAGATLDIVGDGPLRADLEHLAQRLGIAERVRFAGELAHDALPPVYHASRVFAISSRHEAQGMVALEAAACGRPVVGTRVGVVPEIGQTVAVADANGLAEALAQVCTDAEHATRAGCAARRVVETEFALDTSLARFQAVYRDLSG